MILPNGGIVVRKVQDDADEATEIASIAAGEIMTLNERFETAMRELEIIANANQDDESFPTWAKARARLAIAKLQY